MSCFLFTGDDDNVGKIDIDELYEKQQRRDMKQLSIFNKILNRIHKRIRVTGRSKMKEQYIWFTIPEYIFGEPLYNQGDCLGYLVSKLEENGFHVRYLHPNTLFVSWANWIPSYIRTEVKKKTGKVLDEKGNIIRDLNAEEGGEGEDMNSRLFNDKNPNGQKGKKEYTPLDQYKPTGNLVYNQDLFDKLDKKIR